MIGEPAKEGLGRRALDRLGLSERREAVGVVILGALILGGVGLWYVRSLPGPVEVGAAVQTAGVGDPGALEAPGGEAGAGGPSPSPSILVVDVAGWVRHPGVYEFQQGDRVIDAIQRAGGAKKGADLTSINLAAMLLDAEQIVVGRREAGEAPVTGTSSGSSAGAAGPEGEPLVNVNTATLDELESLPGIGEVLGQRIIDYREEHGPFGSVEDLLDVSGIGDATLEELRPNVTV